jgi:signal peptidase I
MAVVRSDAMRPTLESGDVLFVSRVHRRSRLRRGEILVRRAPDARESFVPVGDVVGVARMRLLPWPITATGVLAR